MTTSAAARTFYGELDPLDSAVYGPTAAAHYLGIPVATLRSWFVGQRYPRGFFRPLLAPAGVSPLRLSFRNLVEAFTLRALRIHHRLKLPELRTALEYAEAELRIKQLLTRPDLMAAEAGGLFLERYGQLIDLTGAGQLAMKKILQAHLRRVDAQNFLLYPFLPDGVEQALELSKPIVINPYVAFGHPVTRSRSISTEIIALRVGAGESESDLAKDYDLPREVIEAAVIYETAA